MVARKKRGLPPPSFYRTKDAADAFRHFFVLCVMFCPEDHTCAGCARAHGRNPGFVGVDGGWFVAYVLCDGCRETLKSVEGQGPDSVTTSAHDSEVTRAIDARIAANNVWMLPIPDFGDQGDEIPRGVS